MPFFNIPLTIDDFNQSQWQHVIEHCSQRECDTYFALFFEKAKEAEASKNVKAQEVFTLLEGITSLYFRLDRTDEPLAPRFIGNSGIRSFSIDDLSEEHLNVLSEVVPTISDDEMRARIADILWIKKRNPDMVALAVDAYLDSAKHLEHPVRWPQCVTRTERALQLAAYLGKDRPHFLKVIDYIESVLDKYQGEDPLFLSEAMMSLLLEYRIGDPGKYAALAEKAALRAEEAHAWHNARLYWDVKARWHALEKNAEGQRSARIAIAETYVKASEDALRGANPNHFVAWSHLRSAIDVLRTIPQTRERVAELHKLLLEYQRVSPTEMKSVFIPLGEVAGMTELSERAREAVKSKSLWEALFALASMGSSPQVDTLRRRVQELAKQFPIQHLIVEEDLNELGKVVGRRPSMLSGAGTAAEEFVRAEMFKQAILDQQLHAFGIVEPAREQINLEHHVRIHDLLPLVISNPFVPEGHEMIYARGLHAGLTGDFLVATHLLAPQLENSIRYLLFQEGTIVSKLTSQGIQDERDLNTLFKEYRTELVTLFGTDLAFDIEGLLVEHFGSNLRNEIAHGLISYDKFISLQSSYLWWLTLRLCFPEIRRALVEEDREEIPSPENRTNETESDQG
jgi:hypothetical protein